jgi:hypothetical protein
MVKVILFDVELWLYFGVWATWFVWAVLDWRSAILPANTPKWWSPWLGIVLLGPIAWILLAHYGFQRMRRSRGKDID